MTHLCQAAAEFTLNAAAGSVANATPPAKWVGQTIDCVLWDSHPCLIGSLQEVGPIVVPHRASHMSERQD